METWIPTGIAVTVAILVLIIGAINQIQISSLRGKSVAKADETELIQLRALYRTQIEDIQSLRTELAALRKEFHDCKDELEREFNHNLYLMRKLLSEDVSKGDINIVQSAGAIRHESSSSTVNIDKSNVSAQDIMGGNKEIGRDAYDSKGNIDIDKK